MDGHIKAIGIDSLTTAEEALALISEKINMKVFDTDIDN